MPNSADRIANLSPEKRALLLRRLNEQHGSAAPARIQRREHTAEPVPLSFAQQRLWFLNQLIPGIPLYHESSAVHLKGALDVAALERSLNAIVARHEALRTTFQLRDGIPVQVIAPRLAIPLPLEVLALPTEQGETVALHRAFEIARQPFDLERGPLVRAALVRIQPDAHLLALCLHHIVSDGWSLQVLVKEIAEFYTAEVRRLPAHLPELPIQYADYTLWQRDYLQGPVLDKQLAYWKSRFEGAQAVLELPADHQRPPIPTYNGARQRLVLPQPLVLALRRLGAVEGATLFMTLLAAFQTLLSRYTGQDDVTVGSPIAGRNRAEIEGLIGFFVNTLVLRVDLSGDPVFRNCLRRVREVTMGAYAHQELPFERLVEELHPERILSRAPLFQTMFVLLPRPALERDLADLTIRPQEVDNGTAKFDLLLHLWEQPDLLQGWFEYSTDVFEAATIARMSTHFLRLLEGIAADPDRRLSALPLLTGLEQQQILVDWNATARPYQPAWCLHDMLAAQAAVTPDAIALSFEGLEMTYWELDRRANQLAHHLRTLGVGPEVSVGVFMERSLELVVGLLGVLKAGGAYIPLDPSYPAERLAFMLEDSGAPVLITTTDHRPPTTDHRLTTTSDDRSMYGYDISYPNDDQRRSTTTGQRPPTTNDPSAPLRAGLRPQSKIQNPKSKIVNLVADWSTIARQPAAPPAGINTPDHLAYVIYTSGSTGLPKGAMNTHCAVVNRLRWMQETYALAPADRVLQKTPFSFDVSVWEFFWPLMTGTRMVLAKPGGHQDSAYLVELIAERQITTLHFVPSMLRVFLDEPGLERCAALRTVICSGEALPAATVRRFYDRLHAALHNLYGPTEAAIDVTAWECRRDDDLRSVPIGHPIANVQLHVLDRHARPVPVGVPGELYIGGVQLARGYLNRPELTAERFVPNPFAGVLGDGCWVTGAESSNTQHPTPNTRLYRTGDRARYRPDGAIEYLGRLDYQIKLRGFRIELGEIEALLARHPDVGEVVVAVREDIPGDTRLVAYLVPKVEDRGLKIEDSGSSAPEPLSSILYPLSSELHALLKERLPDYMIPSAFVVLESLPLMPNGKIDRHRLPAPNRAAGAAEYVAPRGYIEELLAGIWADLLHRDRVGVHDDFFALGGHSLLATQVAARLRGIFHVDVPLRKLFEATTIAELAQQITVALAAVEPKATPITRQVWEGQAPVSFAQQRLWFLDQLAPGNPFYNMPAAIRLEGMLDLAVLQNSLTMLVARHATLRTTFQLVNDQPVQVIAARDAMPLGTIDLSLLPPEQRAAEVQRLIQEEAAHPFDLTRGPLVRATILRLADDEHVLLLTMHHIISDGWSIGVLIREMAQLYRALSSGQAPELPPLPIQYADFAIWQREWLQGATLEAQVSYWRQQLAGLPALALPTDRPRPPVQRFVGDQRTFFIAPAIREGLEAMGRQEGATLYMTLLVAFQSLLGRYSGQDDIVVGTPIANRTRAETEGLIGFFVNTLVVRMDLSGIPTAREALGRVRQALLEAYTHQDVPFERLVEELNPERSLSHNPLCQVMFALQNAFTWAIELPDIQLQVLDIQYQNAKFDLGLDFRESDRGLEGVLMYSTDLFDDTTIQRMIGHIQMLLTRFVDAPDERLVNLPILSEAEQRAVMAWNATRAEFPADQLPYQLFEAQAARTPDAPALIGWAGDGAGMVRLTYRQVNERANQLAHYLRERGIGPEIRVGVCMQRSPDLVVSLLGVMKAGGSYVPLDPDYPAERLIFMHEDAQVALLLTTRETIALDSGFSALGSQFGDRVVTLDADWPSITALPVSNVPLAAAPQNAAYLIYTSGSTGTPKAVVVEHRHLSNVLFSCRQLFGFDSNDAMAWLASAAFDISLFEIFNPLVNGGSVLCLSRQDMLAVDRFGSILSEVTRLHTVPSLMHQLVNAIEESGACSAYPNLKTIFIGGDLVQPQLLKAMQAIFPHTQIEVLYGPTEATIICSHYTVPREGAPDKHLIGTPLHNMVIHIYDEHQQLVPVGIPGEVYIAGAGVTRGYLNRPELTGERYITIGQQRFYRTSDSARWLPDGTIEFLGRVDQQVKVRGFRIELGEIETVLSAHPAVRENVVVAHADEANEKRLVAYVVRNLRYQEDSEPAMVGTWSAEQVDRWQVVFDEAHRQYSPLPDPTFNIAGWNSSYTNDPIPAEEMRAWVDQTVERIRSLRPRRILEIGCGTGLLLFRLAPECQEYYGTDFAESPLRALRQQMEALGWDLPQVSLHRRPANNLADITPGQFDVIVLNSVVQYFPSVEYLMEVLTQAVRLVAQGGHIFVGDLRSYPLLEAFHTSVQLYQAQADMKCAELRRRIHTRIGAEEELLVDPAFFFALRRVVPRISDIQVQLKRGKQHNELTRFRYDIILSVDGTRAAPMTSTLDWERDSLTLERVRGILLTDQPAALRIARIPNARLVADLAAVDALTSSQGSATAADVRAALHDLRRGIDPENWWALGDTLPYRITVSWSGSGVDGCYDVTCTNSATAPISGIQPPAGLDGAVPTEGPVVFGEYANQPLQAKFVQVLAPQLRRFLQARLPDYMIPSAFVLVSTLPLTRNGKVDRQALPEPERLRPIPESTFVAPRHPIEEVLARICADVLGLDQVGIYDDFFDLGGHSLLATQVVSRIRDAFQIELPLRWLFETPTVANIAEAIIQYQIGHSSDADIAATITDVSQLSDAEIEALLESELDGISAEGYLD